MNKIRSILVTGGTGSFGRSFISYLLSNTDIERICVYSRSEHTQADLRMTLDGTSDLAGEVSRVRWMVGDVRDAERLRRACRGLDAIVHAAALKRIETGRYNPDELVKTNVLGTMNVIEAATANNVKYVIGLSTDKAYQPISPYGQTKALAESLFLTANEIYGNKTKFSVTRYGNVWAAQGSVVPLWRGMFAAGLRNVPVTDLDCTRFFMTMGEAVTMVYRLLFDMRGGELVIPYWLPAYRLGDLVEAFGAKARVKGLPAWEKLHESMSDLLCSETARRMTVGELKGWIENA